MSKIGKIHNLDYIRGARADTPLPLCEDTYIHKIITFGKLKIYSSGCISARPPFNAAK